MADIQFELDKLRKNINYRVQMKLGGGAGTVTGFLRNEFSVAGEADYTSPFESQAMGKANEKLQSLTGTIDKMFGTGFSAFRLSNILGSTAIWVGTKKPRFQVSMVFIATEPEDNVLAPIKQLMMALYPSTEAGDFVTKSPLGYHMPKGKMPKLGSATGTSIINIGNWFTAPGQLITNVNPGISKEVIKGGKPLYTNVEVSFEPWRLVTDKEIVSFFKF